MTRVSTVLVEEVLYTAYGVEVADPAWYKPSRTRQVYHHDSERVAVSRCVGDPSRRSLAPFRDEVAYSYVAMTGLKATPAEVEAAITHAVKRGFIQRDENGY